MAWAESRVSSTALRQASSSSSRKVPVGGPPALFTKMSTLPNSVTAAWAKSAAASWAARSTGSAKTLTP